MPWTNSDERITKDEMIGFVQQLRNRCDIVLNYTLPDNLIYTVLEDIYEDAQAIAFGYSVFGDTE